MGVHTNMTTKETDEVSIQEAIEDILRRIIDEWYERISPHYLTRESMGSNPDGSQAGEELKRFHDEKGHRIKFNKHELDFTYGLNSYWGDDSEYVIEVSVNNKVHEFDYDDFKRRLIAHYRATENKTVPRPYELRSTSFGQIFRLVPNLQEAFRVEKHEGKADIMRLSFQVDHEHIRNLASHPVASKDLIEQYCVSPFRTVYATVYRRQSR